LLYFIEILLPLCECTKITHGVITSPSKEYKINIGTVTGEFSEYSVREDNSWA
jgi:hypothetical protein